MSRQKRSEKIKFIFPLQIKPFLTYLNNRDFLKKIFVLFCFVYNSSTKTVWEQKGIPVIYIASSS